MSDAPTFKQDVLDAIAAGEAEIIGGNSAATYATPKDGWVCFHCGVRFHTHGAALRHFGVKPESLRCEITRRTQERDGLQARVAELEEALKELLTKHRYRTPASTINCRYCDNNMDHEGTYQDMHAPDCPIRRASAALGAK